MACCLVHAKPLFEPMLEYHNLTLRNRFQWNFNSNLYISMHENAFENVICKLDTFCRSLNLRCLIYVTNNPNIRSDILNINVVIWLHYDSQHVFLAADMMKSSKHFLHYWPFVREIHLSLVNSPHKAQLHGALKFSLICAWTNGSVNNHNTGDLRRHRAHYGITVMELFECQYGPTMNGMATRESNGLSRC